MWWGGAYPSAEIQSMYLTAPADWAIEEMGEKVNTYKANRAAEVP